MRTISCAIIVTSFLLLSACSTIRNYTSADQDNLLSGAGSIIAGKTSGKTADFEMIDIEELLKNYGFEDPKTIAVTDLSTDNGLKYKRNDLQDRLIAASNQRCGAYLRVLVSSKSQTQMGWGGFATFLSGAASVTTPASAASVLAAGSTVSNAFLNLYNDAYFSNLAINVISSGISKYREGVLKYIEEEREKTLLQYPVNRAIADALTYHSACNITTGFEAAARATDTSSENIARELR